MMFYPFATSELDLSYLKTQRGNAHQDIWQRSIWSGGNYHYG